jgi:tetratricopeptide (TPR) repeat protein
LDISKELPQYSKAWAPLDQAIKLYEQQPPSTGLLQAYGAERELLQSQGRHDEAAQLSARALAACEGMDDRATHAVKLGERAWDDMAAGDPEAATRRMNQAWETAAAWQSDPRVNVYLAGYHTDILLKTCAPSVDVERAAAPGLQAMIDFGLEEDHNASELRFNLAQARIACGKVDRAADLLDPVIHVPASRDTLAIVMGLAEIAMLRGDTRSAQGRLAELEQMTFTSINFRVEIGVLHADLELWRGDPRSAYDCVVELLNVTAASGQSMFMGRALVIAARAAADINEPSAGAPARARAGISGASCGRLRGAMADDPWPHGAYQPTLQPNSHPGKPNLPGRGASRQRSRGRTQPRSGIS